MNHDFNAASDHIEINDSIKLIVFRVFIELEGLVLYQTIAWHPFRSSGKETREFWFVALEHKKLAIVEFRRLLSVLEDN